MDAFFFDTSAIVKRYVNEIGTAWVRSIVDPAVGNRICLTSITGVEVVSAIIRRARGGNLSSVDVANMLSIFRVEFTNEYRVAEVTPLLISRAMDLAESHALRGADSIQLAAAVEVLAECQALGFALTLVSADLELNAAAVSEGIPVEDPNSHP